MSRRWQYFEGPGPSGERLPISSSPWHQGQLVRIPREHWELIVERLARTSPDMARELMNASAAPWDQRDDLIVRSPWLLRQLVGELERLEQEIGSAEPLTPTPNDDVPDALENVEYMHMVDAVRAVFQGSLTSGKPFSAWVD